MSSRTAFAIDLTGSPISVGTLVLHHSGHAPFNFRVGRVTRVGVNSLTFRHTKGQRPTVTAVWPQRDGSGLCPYVLAIEDDGRLPEQLLKPVPPVPKGRSSHQQLRKAHCEYRARELDRAIARLQEQLVLLDHELEKY